MYFLSKQIVKQQRLNMRRRVAWEFDDRVGEILRSFRIGAKLTQTDLGNRIGCSVSHVCKVERGDQNITVGEFLAWCKAMGVDPWAAI